MSMMRKLLEAMTKFAGEPEQKPGEQWKGTDKGTPGKKLVGDSIIKDLAKGPTPKTKEEELAEAYANFMEDDIGVEPKRPGRKSDRPAREYTKHGKPSKRYTTVENTELNEYKKDADNFTADDIKELEGIKDLATLKARAFALISKPSARPMKPEKVQWFKNRLDSLVSPMAVIKLMYDLLLSGEGQRVIGSRSSMGANSYRSRFSEGWNTGSDRVSLDDSTSAYWNGQGSLQKEYDALYEKLVPASGAADTMEGEVLRAASKIVYRHFNDGDEFNKASFDQLKPMIGAVTSYDDLAHKATEFALNANGNYHPNAGWDCLDVMDYGPAEEEEYDDEEDDEDDTNWEEEDDELEESSNVVARYADDRARGTGFVYNVDATGQITSSGNIRHNKKFSTPEKAMAYLDKCGFTKKGELEEADMFKAGQRAIKNIKSATQQRKSEAGKMAIAQAQIDADRENERDRFSQEELYPSDDSHDLDEGAANVYSITSERNGRERSKSGTLAELIEYYGYTLETGKSYERERGNSKINLNPKNIESLVQNLNNAKDNAAANGSSNERFYVDHGNMAEGRGPSKGLHKKVTIVKGRDAGKTGYVRQIKTDKLRNKVYLDLDLEDGGQLVVLKQDVRLVKEVDEGIERRVVFSGTGADSSKYEIIQSGPTDFMIHANGKHIDTYQSLQRAMSVLKNEVPGLQQGVAEARTTWNNDFYVYDPKTKAVKKKFRTHKGATQYAEANGLKVASAEYYHDTVSKDVEEGWESGPEERTRVERDPDAEYDARRQEKLDAPYAQKEPEAKGYHVVSLDTRQPVTDKVFPTKGHAMAYIQSNHGKNLAYRAINEHWDQEGYDPRGQNPELAPGQKALKGKPVKAKDAINSAQNTLTKAFGGTAKDLTNKLSIKKGVSEGIESGDPVESAVLRAVQELIQQGHTEVAPEVITNMVVAATSQPFLLKDLVDANNNSPAIQHYVDSINPTKVKFSNEILTVKNEDPAKDKKQAQAGVSSMAARAASRNRLGEGSETPLRDPEDYQAKRSALQQIQMDPDTHKDPQLKAELARRLGSLNQQYSDLQSKLREFKESRGHKAVATKLGNMDRMQNVQIPTPAERQEQLRIAKEKETVKKPVKEFAVPGATTVATATPGAKPADPAAIAKAAAATNTLKAATGTTVAPATLDKALDSATQGTATSTDVKALAPIMGVLNKAAADPKLASQFKTIANQAKLTP